MAQDFNTGPNAAPGGAPENARVNDAAMNAELKQAQILQNNTIKGLTDTIEKLTKQYEELTQSGKDLSQDEARVSKELQDKIQNLSEVLKNTKDGITKGESSASLSGIGQKERIQTFDKLTSIIKDFQKSNAAFIKTSGEESSDNFDAWFASYTAQKKSEIESLKATENNNLLLGDIKKILKLESEELANLNDEELTVIAKKNLKLTLEQKTRDLEFYEQNKGIIRITKLADEHEQEGVKKIISSSEANSPKPTLEHGFKSIHKSLNALVQNTKSRNLFQIIADLLGPVGHIIMFMMKWLFVPAAIALGLFVGVIEAQIQAFGTIGRFFKSLYTTLRGVLVEFASAGKYFKWISTYVIDLAYVFSLSSKMIKRSILDIIAEFKFGRTSFIGQLGVKVNNFLRGVDWVISLFRETGPLRKVGYAMDFTATNLLAVGKKFTSAVRTISESIVLFGRRLKSTLLGIISPFTKMERFLGTKTGMFVHLLDVLFGGFLHVFTLFSVFRTIGRYSVLILGPLAGIFQVLMGLPTFFRKIFSGSFREALKALLGMAVLIMTQFFSGLLGPAGPILALTLFNFEKILKWFDPLFDLIVDIVMWVGSMLAEIWETILKPLIVGIEELLDLIVDTVFLIVNFAVARFKWTFNTIIKPLFGWILWGLSWLAKLIVFAINGWVLLFKVVIIPAVKMVSNYIGEILTALEDSLISVLNSIIDWVNSITGWLGMKKISRFETNEEAKKKEELAAAERKKQELEEKNKKDMQGAVKDGVMEGMEAAQEVIKDIYDFTKEDAVNVYGALNDMLSGDGRKIAEIPGRLMEGLKNGWGAVTGALDKTGISDKIGSGINSAKGVVVPMLERMNAPQMQYATNANPNIDQQSYVNNAMGFTPPTNRSEIINNNNNVYNTTSGGGSSILPIISAGHTDPTKVSLQIGLRPPG